MIGPKGSSTLKTEVDFDRASQIDQTFYGEARVRVHDIPEIGIKDNWPNRDTYIKTHFDELKDDDGALYSVPLPGDWIVSFHGRESWIYRVEQDVSFSEFQYDGPEIRVEDYTTIRFKLTRAGVTNYYQARLIEYREGFWAKLTGSSGFGYTFKEIHQPTVTDWVEDTKAETGGIYAYEQSQLQNLPDGLRVWVTKVFEETHWDYAFSVDHENLGNSRQELWSTSDSADVEYWDIEQQNSFWGVKVKFVSRIEKDADGNLDVYYRTAEYDAAGHLHRISSENGAEISADSASTSPDSSSASVSSYSSSASSSPYSSSASSSPDSSSVDSSSVDSSSVDSSSVDSSSGSASDSRSCDCSCDSPEWDDCKEYDENDCVTHNGKSWMALCHVDAGDEPGVSDMWLLCKDCASSGSGSTSSSVDSSSVSSSVDSSSVSSSVDSSSVSSSVSPSSSVESSSSATSSSSSVQTGGSYTFSGSGSSSVTSSSASSLSSGISSSSSSTPSIGQSTGGFQIQDFDTEANILASTPSDGTIAYGTDTQSFYVYDSSLGWAEFTPS